MSSTTPDHGDYEEECSLAAKLVAQQHFAGKVGECLNKGVVE